MATTSTGLVPAENASAARRRDAQIAAEAKAAAARENRGFVQVYELGWRRLQTLMATQPQAARLYALLAEHIDGTGAVVATREVLAEMLGVSVRTISRHAKTLEGCRALVRIPLQGGVYAYCLNPEEVWKAYDNSKTYAAFHTRTLVSKNGPTDRAIQRRLRVMINERKGQSELPLEDDQ